MYGRTKNGADQSKDDCKNDARASPG